MRRRLISLLVLAAAQAAPAAAQTAAGAPPEAMRGDQIIGDLVYGPDGEEIGTVSSVVIDREGGDPAAVVGVGGFLGIGERDVAIPLDRLELGRGDRLTTDMTPEQIGSIERYDAGAYGLIDPRRTLGEDVSG